MAVTETQPERKAAPGPLELVRNFVNSVDFEDGEEELATAAELRRWLVERGLLAPSARVGEADLHRAIDVREGLRAILLSHNGEGLDREAVARLDRAAGGASLRVHFGPEPRLKPRAKGVDGALASLLALVAAAQADGSWQRMKACSRHSCRFAFYDSSKNHSKRWCRMESCGNVEKARAHRARRRAGAPGSYSTVWTLNRFVPPLRPAGSPAVMPI
jgi:predicted RNA-binding Zn ribbon-like protein